MTLLVDTSALYALIDRDDLNHQSARTFWSGLSDEETPVTHNYVLVETCELVRRRLGIDAVQALVDDLLQPISTLIVDEQLHQTAVAAMIASRRRDVSLVDRVSFEVMRRLGLTSAFAYDPHFADFGFRALPG
jgi:predicted nucleic acid-binding protein